MASTHIEVQSTASRLSALTRSTIDRMRDVQNDLQEVKDIFDQVASGSDWTSLATYLGTTDVNAQLVYNYVTAAVTPVTSAAYNDLIDHVG